MNTSDNRDTCANTPCQCAPRPYDAYCSEYCKHTATSGVPRVETACECGHEDCPQTHAAQPHPAGAAAADR